MPEHEEREVALLLPGMSFNASIFPNLPLATIAVDFNELALGKNGGEVADGKMAIYSRMLDDFLSGVDSWKQKRRIVVAHSFGGMLALWWLLSHRNEGVARIAGMVLIATTAGPMFDVACLRVGFLGRNWRVCIKHLLPWWNAPWVTRGVKRLLSHGRLSADRVDFRTIERPSDLSLDLAGWRNTDWRAMRSYRIAMSGFDVRHRLAEVAIPTIVLHGTEDTLFPLEVAEDLVARLPNAELRVITGAGHGLPLTHGEAVVAAVKNVLET
ncbi:MAG: alpha/beta fold hydrolase [Gemmatimonadales bacterium]|nr:alpha/beta fold hydrolase [Gemmatimonadales bacterium]NIN13346.1 alpha/beta fold hydrolase [Gemmatimonadales bacterium]NIN51349.1 alpha/beta fold hydrolase [Gemmatimonadales bacterium]NIP08813.1 alpha/beta fold hydrolase [Gemmatimonadales bacterium]NIQ99807.1 alpha/beta fold hydrolase [Gemmatimonadales bacterium]